MTNSITIIRNAAAQEATEISNLAIRSKAYWGYTKEFMEACRQELTVTSDEIDSPSLHYVVAECGKKIVGFYEIAHIADSEYELEALFVEPKHIGMGIGRTLMSHAKNTVKERGGRTLVIQGDPNAEKFYRAAGGELTGKRESYSIPGRFLPVFTIGLTREDIA